MVLETAEKLKRIFSGAPSRVGGGCHEVRVLQTKRLSERLTAAGAYQQWRITTMSIENYYILALKERAGVGQRNGERSETIRSCTTG